MIIQHELLASPTQGWGKPRLRGHPEVRAQGDLVGLGACTPNLARGCRRPWDHSAGHQRW